MRKYLFVDKSKCTGCRQCEFVCSFAHVKAYNPGRTRIRVVRDDCLDFKTLVCNQCPDPVCIKVCPLDAISCIDGLVIVDENLCNGCGKCVESCNRIFMDELAGKAINCDLCGECVKECPETALKIKTAGVK